MKRKELYLLILMAICFQPAFSQHNASADSSDASLDTIKVISPPKPRPSPMAVAIYKEENIYLKVTYCQPSRKGRDIFTEIAPYGKLWRTGANEATEITVTKDFKLGGKALKAGTYTLFSIPNPDKWTIILNSELGQWGDYKYDETKNILTFDVPVLQNNEIYEAFTIQITESQAGANLLLLWDRVKVVIPFAFTR
jgi:hypothetical protein